MEPMKWKWASSRVDLGYTELFRIPEVTSVFTSSCASVLGDSLLSVSSGMYRERPDSKEGRISLQWLKFRLVFHVTR